MKIASAIILFLLISPSFVLAQTEENLSDFQDLEAALELVVALENDEALAKTIIDQSENASNPSVPNTCPANSTTNEAPTLFISSSTPPVIVKTKPKVRFYMRTIAPVEEIKNTKLEAMNLNQASEDLRKVIEAQDEVTRDLAIKELCAGKTNMEKIGYGNALFNMLGDVYNTDLASSNSGSDPFSSTDPTKDPSNFREITIQRQYNAINAAYLGSPDFPPVGGICIHAATLVTNFLTQCGFQDKHVLGVGYRTLEGGHAIVKVQDPTTGKSYELNWGEITEQESQDQMANYDISSATLPSSGMIIQLYEPNGAGKQVGMVRSNTGTVLARVLGVDNETFDVTTFTYNELGVAVDLGSKQVKYESGRMKEVHNELINRFALSQNNNNPLDQKQMFSYGLQYKNTRLNQYQNGLFIRGNTNASIALYNLSSDHVLNEQQGMAGAFSTGFGVGKNFKHTGSSVTTIEGGANIAGEVYYYRNPNKFGNEYASNVDGSYYSLVYLKAKHTSDKFSIEGEAQSRFSVGYKLPASQNSIAKDLHLFQDNTQGRVTASVNLPNKNILTNSYNVIATADKTYFQGDVGFQATKQKLNLNGGFLLIKNTSGQQSTYTILKVAKDFDLKKLNLNASVGMRKSLTDKTPVMVQGTIILTPNFSSKR